MALWQYLFKIKNILILIIFFFIFIIYNYENKTNILINNHKSILNLFLQH